MFLALAGCSTAKGPPPNTVASVDLARYAGTWHEVARFANWFQDGNGQRCVQVTATYTQRPDGRIGVRNVCRDDRAGGKEDAVEGVAYASDESHARLRVSFFWPFYGDYWVIGLDPAYRWAVVGAPGRDYLWILSRSAVLPAGDYAQARAIAAAEGFDLSKLHATPPQPETADAAAK